MSTETNLTKVNIFPSKESYEQNAASLTDDEIALVPIGDDVLPIQNGGTGVSSMSGTDYATYRPRGIALMSTAPVSIPDGCIVGVYE